MPKVSIIVLAYNNDKYLKQTLDSIEAQTYEDWEVIVINDGSTDTTPEILRSYETKPKFRVFHQSNLGIPASMNRALKLVQGQYICKLDSDDYWDSSLLENLVSVMDNSTLDIGIVYCDSRRIDSDNRVITDRMVGFNNIMSKQPVRDLLFGLYFPESTFLYRREVFSSVGDYDESYPVGSVYDMFIRIAHKYKYRYVDKKLGYYRTHLGCVTKNKEILMNYFARIIEKNKELFLETGIDEAIVEKAIYLCQPNQYGHYECPSEDLMARLMVYSKFFYLKNHVFPDLKEICIYGAGAGGRYSPEAAEYFGMSVQKIFDSSYEKKGLMISEISVTHADDIYPGGQAKILIMSEHADEIAQGLLEKGLRPERDYFKMF